MRKLTLFLLIFSLLTICSCTSSRMLNIEESNYITTTKTYELELMSEKNSTFKVYRVNKSGYAIIGSSNPDYSSTPSPNSTNSSTIDVTDLEYAIILDAEKAHDFKSSLEQFINLSKEYSNKAGLFTEVNLYREIKYSTDSNTKVSTLFRDSESEDVSSIYLTDTATTSLTYVKVFSIQAYTDEDLFNETLTIVYSNGSNEYDISLNDVIALYECFE